MLLQRLYATDLSRLVQIIDKAMFPFSLYVAELVGVVRLT